MPFISRFSVCDLDLGRNTIVTNAPATEINQSATLAAKGKMGGINPTLSFIR